MLEISTTGFEKRIAAEVPSFSRGQAKKAAKKLAWMAQNMRETFDFFEGLRILGIISDPTARDAVRNVEAQA